MPQTTEASRRKASKPKNDKGGNKKKESPPPEMSLSASELDNGAGDADGVKAQAMDKQERKQTSKKKLGRESAATPKVGLCSSVCGKTRYIFLLLFVPPFLNYASLQREAVELKPAGELYDVGWGQKLLLSCTGKGPPTVVFDAPTGMSSDVWTLVAQELSQHARVCTYDRAGLGFSERPLNKTSQVQETGQQLHVNHLEKWNPFTVERMVEDLHRLISSSSQQPRPFILVGAELGALVAQFYAHLYETDLLGLVLVNPLSDDLFSQPDSPWIHHWFSSLTPTYQTLQLGAALGVTRIGLLLGALKQPVAGDEVPNEVVLRQKYLLCHPRHLSSVVAEHYFINETFSQIRTLRKLKSLPSNMTVSVLTGNYYDEQMPSHLNKAWAVAERSLLSKLPPHVQHLVVNGADRHIMYRKPKAIVEAVMKIIRKWRRSQPLSGTKTL